MKVQSKWGIEVEARRWSVCPHCDQEVEVSLFPDTEDETTCTACGATFSHDLVQAGRLSWQFIGDISDELAEQIIAELREDAEQWGAVFTWERTDS